MKKEPDLGIEWYRKKLDFRRDPPKLTCKHLLLGRILKKYILGPNRLGLGMGYPIPSQILGGSVEGCPIATVNWTGLHQISFREDLAWAKDNYDMEYRLNIL